MIWPLNPGLTFQVNADGSTRVIEWPDPWRPFQFGEGFTWPLDYNIAGLDRLGGWLWEYREPETANPPMWFIRLRPGYRVLGVRLIRADGIYLLNAIGVVAIEVLERLNFSALFAVYCFCRRRGIGDMKGIEGGRAEWLKLWRAMRRKAV